jgi:hypothetical protein
MSSRKINKQATQINYDICIRDSVDKFNMLVSSISNDYSRFLDLHQEDIERLKKPEFTEQLRGRLRNEEFDKKYQALLKIMQISFSNEILKIITEIADEYKYSLQNAGAHIFQIRNFLDRYTNEENYNRIYSEAAAKKHRLENGFTLGQSNTSTNIQMYKPKWIVANDYYEITDFLCEIFFNQYYQDSSIKNEGLNIQNYPIVYYYLAIFFKPLVFLIGIHKNLSPAQRLTFLPTIDTNVPNLSYCFNFFNKNKFQDDFNVSFIREYLVCIKELLDCIILIGNDFQKIDNYEEEEDEEKKIKLLEDRIQIVEKNQVVLTKNITSTIHDLGELQDNRNKRGGKKQINSYEFKSRKQRVKNNNQTKSKRRY